MRRCNLFLDVAEPQTNKRNEHLMTVSCDGVKIPNNSSTDSDNLLHDQLCCNELCCHHGSSDISGLASHASCKNKNRSSAQETRTVLAASHAKLNFEENSNMSSIFPPVLPCKRSGIVPFARFHFGGRLHDEMRRCPHQKQSISSSLEKVSPTYFSKTVPAMFSKATNTKKTRQHLSHTSPFIVSSVS